MLGVALWSQPEVPRSLTAELPLNVTVQIYYSSLGIKAFRAKSTGAEVSTGDYCFQAGSKVVAEGSGAPLMSSRKKMVLVALDATPLAWLQDNLSALPNIRSLIENGHLCETNSPAALISACPWQTFASGLTPGEVGHYFPMQWDAERMQFVPVKQNEISFEPFWNDLDRSGVETIVFDAMSVPVSRGRTGHPDRRLEHAMQLRGRQQPSRHPPSHQEDLRQEADRGRGHRQEIATNTDASYATISLTQRG